MALEVVDRAIQSYGAEGLSQDQELARMWSGLRTLRLADVRITVSAPTMVSHILTGSRRGTCIYLHSKSHGR